MHLTKNELKVIELIPKKTLILAKAIKKSKSQTYLLLRNLKKKKILDSKNKILEKTHIILLKQLLSNNSHLIKELSNSGIEILQTLPANIKEIEYTTKLKKSQIYNKLKDFKNKSIIKKEINKFKINEKIWPELKKLIHEINEFENNFDPQIPTDSIIYYKNKEKIIFSNKNELEFEKTAFSSLNKLKIKIYPKTNYYTTSKNKSKKNILEDCLKITKKDFKIQNLIIISIIILKHPEISQINDEIIYNLKEVLKDKVIKNYPTLDEIKDRMENYND